MSVREGGGSVCDYGGAPTMIILCFQRPALPASCLSRLLPDPRLPPYRTGPNKATLARFKNKAAEMSFITLDILADVLVDFSRELSETDCQNDLMSLVFQVLLDVMTTDQCEAVVDKTFDLLQVIIFDFPGLLFSGRPEYAGGSPKGRTWRLDHFMLRRILPTQCSLPFISQPTFASVFFGTAIHRCR